MANTRILCEWREEWRAAPLQTGVSLHSHTSCSREPLDFLPRCRTVLPCLGPMLDRYEARYRRVHGRELDYAAAWWTPPLGPREALRVEREQIERLGLQALVSITDHDTIEAPLALRLLPEGGDAPVSMEWTVPWRGTVFHLGVHNLPAARARSLERHMAAYSAAPQAACVEPVLEELSRLPQVLVVFNHPYWDEKGSGANYHAVMAEQFLVRHRRFIHALELNGLRPWKENRRTLDLAARYRLPCLSGGDRHGCEPNALLNLAAASDFDSFAEEVRRGARSTILVMKQYRDPLFARILASICDVMRDQRQHSYGWVRWSDRVFFRNSQGQVKPLSEAFAAGREPSLIRLFVLLMRAAESRGVRYAVRQMLAETEEFA